MTLMAGVTVGELAALPMTRYRRLDGPTSRRRLPRRGSSSASSPSSGTCEHRSRRRRIGRRPGASAQIPPGVAGHSADYSVELATTSGRRVALPSLQLDPRTGSAGQAIPVDLRRVASVRLVGPRGDVLEAQLPRAPTGTL
jgi:hypothetical protein